MARTSFDTATTTWRVRLPEDATISGPALTPALREVEATQGLTAQVLWAYARAMPALLGEALMEEVQPLGFARGALVAIATEVPVHLPDVRYVQTRSVEVCRALGGQVSHFHVQGRACVEALIEHGVAVKQVWARHCEPLDTPTPFALTYLDFNDAPPWWGAPGHMLQLARLGDEVWLCWDRDLKRAVVMDNDQGALIGAHGPEDVVPWTHAPAWASAQALAMRGSGWAATRAGDGSRSGSADGVVTARGRRWLLLHTSRDTPRDALIEAWHAGEDLRGVLSDPHQLVTCAELTLDEGIARFRWVGFHRVLLVRGERVEQLTTDHDLRWHLEREGSPLTPEAEAALANYTHILGATLHSHDMEEGRCALRAGDRLILIEREAHDALRQAAGGALGARLAQGSPKQVARWAREALGERGVRSWAPVVIVDADAQTDEDASGPITQQAPLLQLDLSRLPSTRELYDTPARFHNKRLRMRGIAHVAADGVATFCGATLHTSAALEPGVWLVAVDGQWRCDARGRASLPAEVELIDLAMARPVVEMYRDHIFGERPYVPLVAALHITRGLAGWRHQGRLLTRLGADPQLPVPPHPDAGLAQVVFIVDAYGTVGVASWEALEPFAPLEPEGAMPGSPGPPGRLITTRGLLTASGSGWPLLDGVLEVVPPPASGTAQRQRAPSARDLTLMHAWIGDGALVRVMGEVGAGGRRVDALEVEGPRGMWRLDEVTRS